VLFQNLNGNTILHYAYEYNFEELAEYMKDKGADDSLLNAEGLTCYEGLVRKSVDEI
jgi:ankyrin repeat protein